MKNRIKEEILESAKIKTDLAESCVDDIITASNLMLESIINGGKIIWCGNGGSAADAQHLSTELMGGMTKIERKPIPSIALTTDTSFLTAWTNDTDFETVFSRQIQGIGSKGDVLVGISTSGNSKNIIAAIKQAQFKELTTIGLTGASGGVLAGIPDVTIRVPSDKTERIQECHIMIGQILCKLLENSILS